MNETIDLNCDLGEGRGDDAAILPFVTSANVACGLHAGGPSIMRQTVEGAARLGVAVGAHPGFADRAGFGRTEQTLTPTEIYDLVAYQIGALEAFTRKAKVVLQHVKAHGALYHLASRSEEIADAVVTAARETAGRPVVMGPPGSALEGASKKRGLRFAAEGFADRPYRPDGTLVPRDDPGAVLAWDDDAVAARALLLARDGKVLDTAGGELALAVQTICLHGDDARAAGRARAIREALTAAGMKVRPLAAWLPLMSALEVVRPGLLLTVQDLGRPGLGRFGVSPAGAMDPLALRITNHLVGNAEGAPALEITGPGAELRVSGESLIALGGADLGAALDGAPLALWQATPARDGAVITFGARRRGARAVLAVAGGLQTPVALGSASADLDAGLGTGRLGRGARLACGPAPPPRALAAGALAAALAGYDQPFRLRFVPDEDPAVSAPCAALFVASAYRVSDRSNRTGYRLTGTALPVGPAADRLSEPVAPGLIQLPPDGLPILLMADRQTTGGYPRLGHLIAADRPRAGQLWPGDEIRFVRVTLAEAHRADRAAAAALAAL